MEFRPDVRLGGPADRPEPNHRPCGNLFYPRQGDEQRGIFAAFPHPVRQQRLGPEEPLPDQSVTGVGHHVIVKFSRQPVRIRLLAGDPVGQRDNLRIGGFDVGFGPRIPPVIGAQRVVGFDRIRIDGGPGFIRRECEPVLEVLGSPPGGRVRQMPVIHFASGDIIPAHLHARRGDLLDRHLLLPVPINRLWLIHLQLG